METAKGVAKGVAEVAKGSVNFTARQLFRPIKAISTGTKDTLKFTAKTLKDKSNTTYKQWVNQTEYLRRQKPGQAFVKKEQPQVYGPPRGCIDVRTFGGQRRRRQVTRKRSNKIYQTRRKRKT